MPFAAIITIMATAEPAKDAARLGTAGMVARFKPLHNGHLAVLDAVLDRADELVIGIGSPNKYDNRNPFTAAESEQMIRLALEGRSNYRIIHVKDLDDGPRWKEMVPQLFGRLDTFVTANDYVAQLLKDKYAIVDPRTLLPPDRKVRVCATMVRYAIAANADWQDLVPAKVAGYITANKLDERVRREFGLKLLSLALDESLAGELR